MHVAVASLARLIVITLLSCLAGWGTTVSRRKQARRDDYIASHGELPPEIKSAIKRGRLRIGMTKEQVLASWGPPGNTSTANDKIRETWIYQRLPLRDRSSSCAYLYFEGGRLRCWKSTE
jgi:hypothetical protein